MIRIRWIQREDEPAAATMTVSTLDKAYRGSIMHDDARRRYEMLHAERCLADGYLIRRRGRIALIR